MERATPLVEVTVGPPGSGKSTYARKRAEEGALVVNIDAIVTMLHGGNYHRYNDDYDKIYKAIEFDVVKNVLLAGEDLVFDRCCNKRDTRVRVVRIAKQFGATTRAVMFETGSPEQLAERRLESDARGYTKEIWMEVIERRIAETDPVDEELEGFDETLVVSTLGELVRENNA